MPTNLLQPSCLKKPVPWTSRRHLPENPYAARFARRSQVRPRCGRRQKPQKHHTGTATDSGNSTTWYFNGEDSLGLTYEREDFAVSGGGGQAGANQGHTEHRHFIATPNGTVAVIRTYTVTATGAPAPANGTTLTNTRYLHHDHLGSVVAVTNEAGQVVDRLAYDPWGKRRQASYADDPAGTTPLAGVSVPSTTTVRGFTLHEQLDHLGLVHMNGRVYDPSIGRFLSADPYVQAPDDGQSYNRYSYVFNNPTGGVDPSGYFSFKSLFKIAVIAAVGYFTAGAVSGWLIGGAVNGIAAGTIGWELAAATAISSTSGAAAIIGGAAGGFAASFVASGGNLEAGFQGAITGGLFGAIGNLGFASGSGFALWLRHRDDSSSSSWCGWPGQPAPGSFWVSVGG